MADNIGNGPNGNRCHGSIDCHSASIRMGYRHHPIHIRVFWQKLFFDSLHCHLEYSCGTLNCSHNSQKVPGSPRTVIVFIPHPGRPGRKRQFIKGNDVRSIFHVIHRRAFRQLQHVFINPVPFFNVMDGIA